MHAKLHFPGIGMPLPPPELVRKAAFDGRAKDLREFLEMGSDPNWLVKESKHPNLVGRPEAKPAHVTTNLSNLVLSAMNGHVECVELLLKHGARIEDREDITGISALQAAAASGHTNCVRALLAAGAAVDAENKGGTTALLDAVAQGKLDCAALLLGYGADPCRACQDKTPSEWAKEKGHPECVSLLGAAIEHSKEIKRLLRNRPQLKGLLGRPEV